MNVLTRVWRAFASLAEAVEGIAATLRNADGRLRASLALDGPAEAPAAPTATVIDNAPQATHEALSGPRRNGRKATA
jgi:hypothetical protein